MQWLFSPHEQPRAVSRKRPGRPLPGEAAPRELLEVVRVVGDGEVVHPRHRRRVREAARGESRGDVRPRRDTGKIVEAAPVEHAPDELGEDEIALSRDGRVEEREAPHRLGPHHAFAVRAAEKDEGSGSFLLDPPRESERGDVLLEDAREADDPRPVREDLGEAPLDEPAGPLACAVQPRDEGGGNGPRQLARSPAGAAEEDLALPPLVRARVGPEERLAEDPLSRELADRAGAVGGDLRVEPRRRGARRNGGVK